MKITPGPKNIEKTTFFAIIKDLQFFFFFFFFQTLGYYSSHLAGWPMEASAEAPGSLEAFGSLWKPLEACGNP